MREDGLGGRGVLLGSMCGQRLRLRLRQCNDLKTSLLIIFSDYRPAQTRSARSRARASWAPCTSSPPPRESRPAGCSRRGPPRPGRPMVLSRGSCPADSRAPRGSKKRGGVRATREGARASQSVGQGRQVRCLSCTLALLYARKHGNTKHRNTVWLPYHRNSQHATHATQPLSIRLQHETQKARNTVPGRKTR